MKTTKIKKISMKLRKPETKLKKLKKKSPL